MISRPQHSDDYQVESILDRKVFSGKVLYLTKWKGFPSSDATWESVKVLKPYRHLIRLFHEKHRPQTQSPKKESPENPQPCREDAQENEAESQIHPKLEGTEGCPQDPQRDEPNPAPTCSDEEGMKLGRGWKRNKKKAQLRSKNEGLKEDDSFEEERSSGYESREASKGTPPIRLLLIEDRQGSVEYVVEEDGVLKRYQSRQLSSSYAGELVRCLERALLRDRRSLAL